MEGQKEFSVKVYMSDAGPHGIGRQQPPAGAYQISCIDVEYRQSKGKNKEWGIFLTNRVDTEGEAKGMTFTSSLMLPSQSDSPGKRDARTAEIKAALITFGADEAQIKGLINTEVEIGNGNFMGRQGHVWFEPGNDAAPNRDTNHPDVKKGYSRVRYITGAVFADIRSGKVKPRLVNVITGAPAGTVTPTTVGTPPTMATPLQAAPMQAVAPIGGDNHVGAGNVAAQAVQSLIGN